MVGGTRFRPLEGICYRLLVHQARSISKNVRIDDFIMKRHEQAAAKTALCRRLTYSVVSGHSRKQMFRVHTSDVLI